MEKKRVDEQDPSPVSLPKDRFGFLKQETNSPDGLAKSRSAAEYERYPQCGINSSCSFSGD